MSRARFKVGPEDEGTSHLVIKPASDINATEIWVKQTAKEVTLNVTFLTCPPGASCHM